MAYALNENRELIRFNNELGTASCYVELHRKSGIHKSLLILYKHQRETARMVSNVLIQLEKWFILIS